MKRLFLIILPLLAACAHPAEPLWTEIPSSDALLKNLATTTGQVSSLEGAATVNLTVNSNFFSSQQLLVLEKPDRLRTDVMTGFGQLLLQLTSDGEVLSAFSNTTVPGRFFRGSATAKNLARFTRIPLPAKDWVRLLLYDPPMIDFRQSEVLIENPHLVLRLTESDLQQELLFDDHFLLSGCRYALAGKIFLEVLYQELDEQQRFPHTIRINLAAEKIKTALIFSELQTNVEIPVDRFRLKKPGHIPVEDLP